MLRVQRRLMGSGVIALYSPHLCCSLPSSCLSRRCFRSCGNSVSSRCLSFCVSTGSTAHVLLRSPGRRMTGLSRRPRVFVSTDFSRSLCWGSFPVSACRRFYMSMGFWEPTSCSPCPWGLVCWRVACISIACLVPGDGVSSIWESVYVWWRLDIPCGAPLGLGRHMLFSCCGRLLLNREASPLGELRSMRLCSG